METGGDNKSVGDHNLQQESQSTEQGNGSTRNNTGNSSDEPTNTDNKNPYGALESSQNQPSTSETVPTDVESRTPAKSNEEGVPVNIVPKHEHGDMAGGVNKGSEIQNPPVQVMERPGESNTSPNYTFPSHVFSKSNANSQVEWSTASNESLFSIYMGNTSFSNDLGCLKSHELDYKPGDVCVPDQTDASPHDQANKFNAISKRTHELQHELSSKTAVAKAAETMREVIMESSLTTENVGKGDDKASNSQRQSHDSAKSYAFQPSSKSPDKSVSSLSGGDKQDQHKELKENETPNAADEAPRPTTDASNNWLSCFPCC